MIAESILMGRAITGVRRTAGGKIRLDGVELVPDTARPLIIAAQVLPINIDQLIVS